jgi:eukaryotic-like serine/threonine-protein kinase
MDALIGTTLAHYRVDEVLGYGGMGVVYGAHDTKLDRAVALKVLPDEIARDAAGLQRMRREAQALAAVQHPNIASIYGFEDQAALPFLVLERVHGETLASRLQRGPLTPEEALQIGHSIASALHVAHERDVVHRDLKPGNVMITTSGVVKVLDFGIAQRETGSSADQSRTRLTQAGAAIGTPGYMSPEQILASDLDHRTDIFSLGCILYECLAGTPPFQGVTAAEVMASTLHRVPSFRLLPGPTPSRFRGLLERCLEKEPDRRPLRMSQVRDEIDACLHGRDTNTVMLRSEAPEKKHNLPHQLTSFIGRKREVEEVHALLREARLLTLTGVGGPGSHG